MEQKSIFIPWISLSLLLLGMLCAFCSAFECNITFYWHFLFCVLIAGAVLLLSVWLKGHYAIFLSSLAVLGIMVFAVLNFAELSEDLLVLAYYINKRSMAYNNTMLIPMEGQPGDLDYNLLLRLIGILLALFISVFAFRFRSKGYGFLPVYLVPMLGLMVGRTPDKLSLACMMAGVLVGYSWISGQERGGKRGFIQRKVTGRKRSALFYLVLAAILFIGISGARFYGQSQEERVLEQASGYLKKQHEMEAEVKSTVEQMAQYVRGVLGLEENGKLSNAEPHYREEAVLEVTTSVLPTSDIYLRGFVGGNYQNGQWDLCNTEDFQNIAKMEASQKQLLNIGYKYIKEFYPLFSSHFLASNISSDGEGKNIRLEYKGTGKWGGYAYVPYFCDVNSIVDGTGESCVSLNGENALLREKDSYYVKCYFVKEDDYEAIEDYMRTSLGTIDSYQYGNMGVKYWHYVRRTYGVLVDKNLSRLREMMNSQHLESSSNITAARMVQRMLRKQAEYSKKLEPVPVGEDYVEFFLFSQKKGYCEHFATAGTLMLRAIGVPARYAAGYKVTPEMFQKNEDGTYTAEVLDSSAHAWTEVFEDGGLGWMPIEMTPGAGDGNGDALNTQVPANTPTPEPTEEPEGTEPAVTQEPTEEPDAVESGVPTTASPKGEKKTGRGKREWKTQDYWNLAFLLFLLCCVLLFIGRLLYLRFLAYRYRQGLSGCRADRNAYIRLRTAQLLHLFRYCGMRGIDSQTEREWCQRVAEIGREAGKEADWERLGEIVQKAEFAAGSVSDEEYECFLAMAEEAEKTVVAERNCLQKFFLRVIGLKISE